MIFIAISLGIIAFMTYILMLLVPTLLLIEALLMAIVIYVLIVFLVNQM